MSNRLIIGLTGSTGSGKSEVSRLLASKGCHVVDADKLAHRVTEKGSPALSRIAERFSAAVLCEDGTLNRAELAKRAFATPQDTADLNAIVHPAVIELMKQEIARSQSRVIVLDVPLLFQSGTDALCDTTVAVTAPPAVREARICKRDGLTTEQAQWRMQAQPSDAYYAERATHVIVNDGTYEDLVQRVETLCAEGFV